jgi:ATP-dependent DNA ligase
MTSNKTYAPLKIDLLPTLRHLPCGTQLDGEIILKARTGNKTEEFLYLFDILMYDYKAKWMLPLYERKQILLSCFGDYLCMDSQIMLAEGFTTGKKRLYEKALAQGDEGIVIKQLDSTYPIGYTRFVINPLWLKVRALGKHVKTGGVT